MAEQSTLEMNKNIVRTYIDDVYNAHNPDAAANYLAPEMTWRGGVFGTMEGFPDVKNAALGGFLAAFPDLHLTEKDIVAEGDTVAIRLSADAPQDGSLFGIPATGRPVHWDAVDMYRLSDGLIVEEWAAEDTGSILSQVGEYTPPWLKK